ncbi:Na(+)/H(+) antiporter subunit F1 [Macrococcoides caseolyticum]|uniref:Na(+)/H(+) antiporter subunit F1 n=1 Tax=Macrococcoides caseolyticum TaxID=69966 RepID=UPI001F2EBF57|nr:Na(+)/H(+) antiporter subunit F1 [Macrococcus caseolyticus]MCE4955776.1 Na(+)/H(+) antiporter subunit F1 [Macrococcus caseolyticus]
MTSEIVTIIIIISLIIVSLSMLGIIYRVIKGPTLADRVVALDALGISLMAMIALFSVLLNTKYYISIIMLLGVLAFLGTTAFAKFIEKGEIVEYDRHNRHRN